MELIVDADMIVYRYAISNLEIVQWDADSWTYDGDGAKAARELDSFIEQLQFDLGCDTVYVTLSDLDNSFRRRVYTAYKANRSGVSRPVLFRPLREHVINRWGAKVRPGLEGDDVAAMRASVLGWKDCVLTSGDKDFRSLPCALYNWDRPAEGVRGSSDSEAEQFFLYQVLVGDQTDNYKGAKGVGPVGAAKLLAKAEGMDLAEAWEKVILPAFAKAKQGPAEALMNARCAHLLRNREYEQTPTGYRARLWTPDGAGVWMEER